jgi:hypothetical protein
MRLGFGVVLGLVGWLWSCRTALGFAGESPARGGGSSLGGDNAVAGAAGRPNDDLYLYCSCDCCTESHVVDNDIVKVRFDIEDMKIHNVPITCPRPP